MASLEHVEMNGILKSWKLIKIAGFGVEGA